MMDRQAFSKGLAWTVLVNLINKAVFPVISIVITRLLGPSPLGAFAILSSILGISEIFRDAGITQTYLADKSADDHKDGSYMGLAIIMAVIPAVLLIFMSGWLAEVMRLTELRSSVYWVAAALICNGIATMPRAKLLQETRIRELAVIDIISGGTGLFLTIVLVLLGFAFWALVIQMVYCSVLTMALSYRAAPIRSCIIRRQALTQTFRRTASLLAANALNNVFLMSDGFIIKRMLVSDALLGVYWQAKNIAYKPADFVTFPLTRMLIVAFSQAAGEKLRLARAYAKSIKATILFVTPAYVLMGLAAGPIIFVLIGPKFEGSVPILSIMSIFLGLRSLGTVAGTALVSDGKARLTLWAQFGGILTGAVLIWLFAGGIGASHYDSIRDYAIARKQELGASSYEAGSKATFQVEREGKVEDRAGRWLIYVYPDGRRGSELVSLNQRGEVESSSNDVKEKLYTGPTDLNEIAGVDPKGKNYRFPVPHDLARLRLFALCFTGAAAVLYGLLLVMSFVHFPVPGEERPSLAKAVGITLLTSAFIWLLSLAPLHPVMDLAIMLVLVPTFHLVAIGCACARSGTAYLSKAGLRRLWNEL